MSKGICLRTVVHASGSFSFASGRHDLWGGGTRVQPKPVQRLGPLWDLLWSKIGPLALTLSTYRAALSGVVALRELCGTHHRAPPGRKNRARSPTAAWAGSTEAHEPCASYAANSVVNGAARGALGAREGIIRDPQ